MSSAARRPYADGRPVPEPVPGRGLQRMAQGVTEVERHPDAARVALIEQDEPPLGQGASFDELEQLAPCGQAAGQPARAHRLEQGEQERRRRSGRT